MAVRADHSLVRTAAWRNRRFYLFIAPFFLLFAAFGLYPLLFSFYLGFTRWDGLTSRVWVGLSNFAALVDDEDDGSICPTRIQRCGKYRA